MAGCSRACLVLASLVVLPALAWIAGRALLRRGNPAHDLEATRINAKRSRLAGSRLTLLTTNDIHSAVEGMEGGLVGHFARLGAMIVDERSRQVEKGAGVLTLDSGDWLGGSVYDGLGVSEGSSFAPEFEFLARYGFDATTLGNHDFDKGEAALLRMMKKHLSVPMVFSNMETPAQSDVAASGLFSATVRHLVVKVPVNGSSVQSTGSAPISLKVGILGILGPDAAMLTASIRSSRETVHAVGFDDASIRMRPGDLHEHLAATARFLRDSEDVDVVVALFHGGREESKDLATAVGPLIDVVLGGHSHEVYYQEEAVGTLGQHRVHSSQCGCEGQYLGVLPLRISQYGALVLDTDVDAKDVSYGFGDSLCRPVSAAATSLWDAELAQQVLPRWRVAIQKQTTLGATAAARGWNVFGSVLYPASGMGSLLASLAPDPDPPTRQSLAEGVSTALLASTNRHLERLGKPPADVYLTCTECMRGVSASGKVQSSAVDNVTLDSVYSLLSVTVDSPVAVFPIPKRRLVHLMDLTDLFVRGVSESYQVATSINLRYRVEFGLPLFNRIQNLTLHSAPYSEWPDYIRVAAAAYILPSLFLAKFYTGGLLSTSPVRADGVDCESVDEVIEDGLPPEYLLFAEYIAGISSSSSS